MKFLSQINVNTEYTLPIVDGTNGQVLATDGNGNAYWGSISAGSTNLDALTDVILTSPSSGQLLRYGIPPGSGETQPVWYNFTPNYLTPSSSIDNLGDVTITSATSGQILQWNGSAWVNATLSTVEYVSKVQHIVKAGVAITKGQAVYVTTSDGTNMIVGLASNAAESTSSKVIGLAASNAATNDQIFVVTEGLLAGLNTSTATAGDPVWLGTNGNLIFGLLNKPVAPAHLVYIGVVTRVQQNNGEIFVNVQNGFELNEIHDALIVSPTAGQLLRRDSDNLWKNWTPNYLTAHPTIANGGSVDNSNGTVIQDITLETNGHVTAITSVDLDTRYYTQNDISGIFGGEIPMAGYSPTNWDTAYNNTVTGVSFSTSTGLLTLTQQDTGTLTVDLDGRYIQSETDTLAIVTGRGNTTTTHIGVTTSSPINLATAGNIGTWIGGIQDGTSGWSITNNGIGFKADNTTYAGIVLAPSNGILYFGRTSAGGVGTMNSWLEVNSSGVANFKQARPQHNGSNLALFSEIPTNLNQLVNGPGYITGYTETDTLATVTARGSSTTGSITVNGYLTVAGGADLYLKAGTGSSDSGDIVFQDGAGAELHRLWGGTNTLNYRTNAGTAYQMIHTGNVGSQSVAYATSAGDSTNLGGLSSARYVKQDYYNEGYNWDTIGAASTDTAIVLRVESSASNPPAGDVYNWSLWQQGTKLRGSQIAVSAYGEPRMFFRGADGNNNVYAAWNEIIHSGNIASQTIGYASQALQVIGQSGQNYSSDNRTISPSEISPGYLQFGFTSWTNNNGAPYADYLHMRSYTDSSGGSDNLVMFKKSGIGMRIWQQTFGSSTAYSSYADVWTTENFTSTNVTNWNTAYGWGNHAGLYLSLSGGTLSGDLNTSGAIKFRDGGGGYSNIIRAAGYPSEGYTSSDKYWMEYSAYGGHHFVLNVDGGVGSGGNSMDDFVIWQGAIDGDRLLELTNGGNLTIRGSFTEQSSIRYKENVKSIPSVSQKVEQLDAVSYNKIGSNQREIGLIAEDVAELFPEVVKYDNEGRPDGVNYSRLSVILLKAVQELSQEVNELKKKLN